MNMWFTVAWLSLIVCGLFIQGVAVFNSRGGDTLSEHLWAWLGIKRNGWKHPPPGATPVTPIWPMRIARLGFVLALAWFGIHIATGGWI